MGSWRTDAGICKAHWEGEERAVPEKTPVPEQGEPEETKRSSVQLKRGPEVGVDEPKAKKGSVASTKEPPKGIELKPASEVAKESAEEGTKAARN